MRFRVFLFLSLSAVATIPFVSFSWMEISDSASRIQQSIEIQQRQAQDIARYIATDLNNAKRLVLVLSLTAAKVLELPDNHEGYVALKEIFKTTTENFPIFENIHLDDKNMISVLYYPEHNHHGESNVGQDHSHRWHASALHATPYTVVVSPVFKGQGATNHSIINIAAPIVDSTANHRPLGVISTALNLSSFAQPVSELHEGKNYSVYLLDNHGQVIYTNDSYIRINQEKFALTNKRLKIIAEMPMGELIVNPLTHSGKVIAIVKKIPGSSWSVLVLRSGDAYQRELTALKHRSYVLVGVILLLTFCLAFFVSRVLHVAIERLNRHIRSNQVQPKPEDTVMFPKELSEFQAEYSKVKQKLVDEEKLLSEMNSHLELEVKNRTKQIRDQHATLTALFEDIQEGVLLFDREGEIVTLNTKAEQLLNEIGLFGNDVSYFEIWAHLKIEKSTTDGEICLVKPIAGTQHPIFVEIMEFSIDSAGDSLVSKGVLLRDVTARENYQKMKDSLMSIVAHELKTPVQVMQLQVETLLREEDGALELNAAERKQRLQQLKDSSEILNHLISDLLDVARIESGSFKLSKSLVHLPLVLKKAIKMVSQAYPRLQITTEVAEDAECFYADKMRLHQLIVNLLSNAARYNDKEFPKALISVRREGDSIEIVVKDNGIGISKEEQAKVFDRFYKVNTLKTNIKTGGTGLGLFIVRAICIAHGGSVDLVSSVGEGTTFTIRIKDDQNFHG